MAFPGEERLRRRGIGGGGARGGRRSPAGGLGSRRGGPRRHFHEHQWPAAALCRGCAAPARERGRGVVGELHRDTRELLVWSV